MTWLPPGLIPPEWLQVHVNTEKPHFEKVVLRKHLLPFQDHDGNWVHAVIVRGDLFVSQQAWDAMRAQGLI